MYLGLIKFTKGGRRLVIYENPSDPVEGALNPTVSVALERTKTSVVVERPNGRKEEIPRDAYLDDLFDHAERYMGQLTEDMKHKLGL